MLDSTMSFTMVRDVAVHGDFPREKPMRRKLLSVLAAGAMLSTAAGSAFAQGESGGAATSGGSTSAAPAPAEATPPAEAAPMAPGPAAGPVVAPGLSDEALIGIGAAALLAGILIAVTQSSSHATSTTH